MVNFIKHCFPSATFQPVGVGASLQSYSSHPPNLLKQSCTVVGELQFLDYSHFPSSPVTGPGILRSPIGVRKARRARKTLSSNVKIDVRDDEIGILA